MFEKLTRYIPLMESGEIGVWLPNQDKVQSLPEYNYETMDFCCDVRSFCKRNDKYSLDEICNAAREIEYNSQIDVSNMSDLKVLGLLYKAVMTERFCDGTIFVLAKEGEIARWLKRLKDVEEFY